MSHASNPQHLPPEKSAREYEAKVADLTAKLQAVCPHDTVVTERSRVGPMDRECCEFCGLTPGWQYRDSRNSRELRRNAWRQVVNAARRYPEEVQP